MTFDPAFFSNLILVLTGFGGAFLAALWISLVIWTYRDIRTRARDPLVQTLATLLVGAKADLDPMELFDLRSGHALDEGSLEMGTRSDRPDDVAEAFHHSLFVGSDDERALPEKEERDHGNDQRTKPFERNHPAQIGLRFAKSFIDRIALTRPRLLGVPRHRPP